MLYTSYYLIYQYLMRSAKLAIVRDWTEKHVLGRI